MTPGASAATRTRANGGAARSARLTAVALLTATLVLCGCGGSGSGSASGSEATNEVAARVRRASPAAAPFVGLTAARVALGTQCLRVVVADTRAERDEGLRGRTDLGAYDGMLFAFPAATNVGFTMSETLVPLTIGFYDGTGKRVDGFRMTPCPGTDASCPVYRADASFEYAVETNADRLPAGPIGTCG